MKGKLNFLTYNKCKEWVKNKLSAKKIKTRYDWIKIKDELPDFIPRNPKSFYADCGWSNWDNFLGIKEVYLSYDKSHKWIHENLDMNKLSKVHEWRNGTWQLPNFIPKAPDKFYKNTGWIDWNNWLKKNKK